MIKRIRQNYHWVVAFLVFLQMIVFGGLLNSAGVYIIPISETLGVTRGSYSVATIPYSITCTLSTMVSGYLFQKFGYKKSAIASLILITVSLVITATCKTLWGFCFSKILMGLGYGVCFTAGAVRIVKDWFFKHQGLVVGLVSMSSGLGGSLLTVILTALIENYGWRTANMVTAVIMAVITLSYLLLRDRPEEMGLRPFGFGEQPKNRKKARQEDNSWAGFSFQELLRHPLFYVMCLTTLVTCTMLYLTSGVVIPHFQDQGFSASEAAMYQSVYMLAVAVGKLLCGALCDKIGPKPITIACMVCAVAGQWILGVTADPVLSYVGVLLFAIGLCMSSIMIPLLAAPLFGYQACLSVNGIFLAMASLATIFSSPISNLCYDKIGSYSPVFRVAAIANGILIAVYFLMFAMAKRERRLFESRQEA